MHDIGQLLDQARPCRSGCTGVVLPLLAGGQGCCPVDGALAARKTRTYVTASRAAPETRNRPPYRRVMRNRTVRRGRRGRPAVLVSREMTDMARPQIR